MRTSQLRVWLFAVAVVFLTSACFILLPPLLQERESFSSRADDAKVTATSPPAKPDAVRRYLDENRNAVPEKVYLDLVQILEKQSSPGAVRGQITMPRDGAAVGKEFQVQGTLSNYHQLWLAVEWGGRIWPKEPFIPLSREWTSKVFEGGEPPNREFTLSLWLVPGESETVIRKWFDQGRKTGHYPGLNGIPGGQRIDQIKLKLE